MRIECIISTFCCILYELIKWLPPYAPELNHVEYLWSAEKQKDLANLYIENISDVDAALRRYRHRSRKITKTLDRFPQCIYFIQKKFHLNSSQLEKISSKELLNFMGW
ncbi:MAG: hypothetical protein A3C00_00160 [Candidatus Jacksonbacteria bacterium RIFCSPHIGHO2_02_FULL_44_25]|nr:MAG: hypothetical protein A3C00_00160 [Candidatus Jacksonbacteria bacterium RIFCSPHIGHO2_02_FULL_44_25]OGY72321.1 MAG: hypothetical protein A3E05_04420 [Candidatus Jacksonbacteria bacterium RIFCSPHIGHO2_12_FULL_44_12]OGY74216.1 MAG: hypothetical protein A3H07_01870 [Candidatus Jacksonbacteria bacterium RIFCSPLOWO2_12_FULL_44_15b]HCE86579.1 hypothetical protein [Candidatus Jacksonbacteria bacterium]